MHNKILTVDDLVSFCEKRNFAHFSSMESGYQLCVQVPAHFEKSESDDSAMFFGNVLVMHTGTNRNKSNLTEDAAKKAIKNLAYKPVLASFCEIDGVRDFTYHDFEKDKDGNYVYHEKQVGCFTANEAYMEQDPDRKDRKNIFAKVAIPREYTDAAEIIERKNGTKVSVELGINELSYNVKDKVLMLESVEVLGLTLLGKNPETGEDVSEGMEGAHIQIEDFSTKNNSLVFNRSELINEITQAVIDRLGNDIADKPALYSKEGGKDALKFNELLKEYGRTIEDISFEYENLSDEELEEAFKKAFKMTETEDNFELEKSAEDNSTEAFDDTQAAQSDDVDDDENDDEDVESEKDTSISPTIDDDEVGAHKKITYSITYGKTTKEFSLSLQDKLYALSTLVNDTYSEADNVWYDVVVYDEDKYVIMKDCWSDKAYKQNYKIKKDVYSLVGDRIAVFTQYLTTDEIKKLDDMRSNYSVVENKLAQYEAEPEKMNILNSDEYSQIADTAEFVELKTMDKHFEMSVDEVREAADKMLLAYAKANKFEFSETAKSSVGIKQFGNRSSNKRGRYGNLFTK